jgi:hypothetical protein
MGCGCSSSIPASRCRTARSRASTAASARIDSTAIDLDQSWFTSLPEARRVIEAWRLDYNERRPHTSLRMRTPAAFAAARPFVKRQQPATAAPDTAPPPDAVAAISAPVLSGSSGFS